MKCINGDLFSYEKGLFFFGSIVDSKICLLFLVKSFDCNYKVEKIIFLLYVG